MSPYDGYTSALRGLHVVVLSFEDYRAASGFLCIVFARRKLTNGTNDQSKDEDDTDWHAEVADGA